MFLLRISWLEYYDFSFVYFIFASVLWYYIRSQLSLKLFLNIIYLRKHRFDEVDGDSILYNFKALLQDMG